MSTATLYRCRTPTNWLCPCGRVARAARRAGYDVEEIRVAWNKAERPEIAKLTGQRHVPVLVIDGEAVCDSKRIVEWLEFRASS